MTTASPVLSIVLSLRNEEAVIPELLKRLQAALQPLQIPYELIFVNDASTDRTGILLEEYAEKNKEVKILHLSRRFGVQPSIWAGIQHAKGDAVITMDADLQDPPELIPAVISKWREGSEVVHMVRASRDGESKLKMNLTRLAYHLIGKLSGQNFPIEAGDFKLLSRRAVNELQKYSDQMPYIRGLAVSLGFSQTSISYNREKRYAGKAHFSLLGRGPVETFLSGVVSFSPLPLYGILAAGLLLTLISVIGFFFSLLSSNHLAVMINLISFMFSLNLIALGIIGIYLWFAFKQTQKHPLYIVERKVNL